MKRPDEHQKRELAELKNSAVFQYLSDSRTDLIDELILSTDINMTRTLQGRVMELTDLLDYITKSHNELTREPPSRQNLKFPG